MSFIGIIIIQFFALLTPGPDLLLVTRTGVTGSRLEVCKVVAGICVGAFAWMALSLLGLHILFQTYPILSQLVMFCGACYLTYLAYCIIKYSNSQIQSETYKQKNLFRTGLFCNLSNPKAIIYYASIFSVLPLGNGITNLILVMFLILMESFICFVGLGMIFSHPTIRKTYQSYVQKIDLVSAIIFLFFAVLMFIRVLFFFLGK